MANKFYPRLANYYEKVAQVLRGTAEAAAVFPNSSDIGSAREDVYLEFLKQHTPKRCNVFKGGYLYHFDGSESAQIDIVITNDLCPRYDLFNKDGNGKSFSPVEGSLAAVSIKSCLDKKQIFEALENLSSIPPMSTLDGRIPNGIFVNFYDDWPLKVIYASDGISAESLTTHITNYYSLNPDIPLNRRPNIIHVAGKYVVLRATEMLLPQSPEGPSAINYRIGDFLVQNHFADVTAITQVLLSIQTNAVISSQITYDYTPVMNNMFQELARQDSIAAGLTTA